MERLILNRLSRSLGRLLELDRGNRRLYWLLDGIITSHRCSRYDGLHRRWRHSPRKSVSCRWCLGHLPHLTGELLGRGRRGLVRYKVCHVSGLSLVLGERDDRMKPATPLHRNIPWLINKPVSEFSVLVGDLIC